MKRNSQSVVLPEYNDNLIRALVSLEVRNRSLPELKENEILVKMIAAPCNPSDIAFLRGGYNITKSLPAVPGFEGVGEVVETGSAANDLLGKRVCCFVQEDHDGTWAEYFIARSEDCFVVKSKIDNHQAAAMFINPLTAYGMFLIVKDSGVKAFIQNAAGGQVAHFLNILATKHNIGVINLVRKEETLNKLKEKGVRNVLNTSDENFMLKLKELIRQLNPLIVFDAVAGEQSGPVFNLMPRSSRMFIYGALSGLPLERFDPMGIIFQNKAIHGFNLNDWIPTLSRKEFSAITNEIQELFISGDFQTGIQSAFPLKEVVKGVRTYIKSMSSGKILLVP